MSFIMDHEKQDKNFSPSILHRAKAVQFSQIFYSCGPRNHDTVHQSRKAKHGQQISTVDLSQILIYFQKTLKYYYFYSCGPTLHDLNHSNTLDGQKRLCGMKDDHQTWSLQILREDILVPKDRGNLPNRGFPSIYKMCPTWLVHFFRMKLTN